MEIFLKVFILIFMMAVIISPFTKGLIGPCAGKQQEYSKYISGHFSQIKYLHKVISLIHH